MPNFKNLKKSRDAHQVDGSGGGTTGGRSSQVMVFGTIHQDPMFERSGRVDPGRGGCRVPWSGDAPPFGFSPDGAVAVPWLPQPADWKDRTVRAQSGDPHFMLELYRAAIAIRRAERSATGS
ncbi:hypothetical protein [Micromonospora rhizosphaerae]|uniref:hypothetical protein n=1 Tax=Micromonospora rhizosphaerae TaxID=568872 RepID=UPI001FE21C18|nr:hypothetical protein [Micromonospora rhizosphaerae]